MYNRRIYLRSRNLPSSLQKQNRKFGLFWSKNGKGDSHDEETITESTSFYQTERSCSFASPRSSVTDHPTFEKRNEGIPKRYKCLQVKDFNKLGIHSDCGKRKGCGIYCNILHVKFLYGIKRALFHFTKNLVWKHQILNLTIGHVRIAWSNEVFKLVW